MTWCHKKFSSLNTITSSNRSVNFINIAEAPRHTERVEYSGLQWKWKSYVSALSTKNKRHVTFSSADWSHLVTLSSKLYYYIISNFLLVGCWNQWVVLANLFSNRCIQIGRWAYITKEYSFPTELFWWKLKYYC